MTAFERFARLGDRLFDRLRDRRSFALDDHTAAEGDLTALRGHAYAVLVTFRRNGDALPSPVWIALDDQGRAYVKTRHDAGKVKRLRNDARAVVAPSNARGRPTGPAIRATGRVLPRDEWPHAEATLAAAYGTGRRVSERVLGGPEDLAAYIELTPRPVQ